MTIKQSPSTIHVSIVMPCLNEEKTLPLCIEEAQAALATLQTEDSLQGEIIVADNGSTDRSISIAEAQGARVVNVTKKGYGSALIGGINAAYGEYIIMGDADASYDFGESPRIVRKLRDGYELCMGNRFKGGIQPGAMPWKNRYIGNPLLTGVLNLIFWSGLNDAHCGLRGFTKNAFEQMRLSSSGMEFASEMVIKATLLDMKRTEVPVTLRPDGRDRKPHLRPFQDGWRHLRYILMLSPAWLFFVPSLLLGSVGAIVSTVLLLNSDQTMARLGPFLFGNHWMILGGAMVVASHQIAMFGFITMLYGIREGYRKTTPLVRRVFWWLNLERMLTIGSGLVLVGVIVMLIIFLNWSSQGFGSLDEIRPLIAASAISLIGIQTFFSGFLLAVINGNKTEFELGENGIL